MLTEEIELKPKEERFAQLYIQLGNASEAYRQAYNSKAKQESVAVNASKLLAKANVSLRVDQLKEETAQQSAWSRLDSIKVLSEIAKGLDQEAKPNDRVNATKALNAMHGFDKQTIDHTSSDGSMTPSFNTLYGVPDDSEP